MGIRFKQARIGSFAGLSWAASLVLVSLAGCAAAGSASFVVKAPVVQQCTQVPLQGCDELSEGVLLYLDGKKAEARVKLLQGAAKNAPEDIRKYALALRALESTVPGLGSYTQPLREITDILIQVNAVASKHLEAGATLAAPSGAKAEESRPEQPERRLTADTELSRMRYGTAAAPEEAFPWCTQAFGSTARCDLVQRGTLVLTDVVSVGTLCEGQFMAIMRGGVVQLRLDGPFDMHGGRVVIPSTDALVLGQRAEPNAQASSDSQKSSKKTRTEGPSQPPASQSCGFYYSGYKPYDVSEDAETPIRAPRVSLDVD